MYKTIASEIRRKSVHICTSYYNQTRSFYMHRNLHNYMHIFFFPGKLTLKLLLILFLYFFTNEAISL